MSAARIPAAIVFIVGLLTFIAAATLERGAVTPRSSNASAAAVGVGLAIMCCGAALWM